MKVLPIDMIERKAASEEISSLRWRMGARLGATSIGMVDERLMLRKHSLGLRRQLVTDQVVLGWSMPTRVSCDRRA